ncbi:MAG TPA: isoprenylcysteine carboxylmethyltransferase family protein, partial [Candidatus Limnocylindrales bacterium]|nr:isoprenylcysteine carboxylmethyltransferase family protein [Candidatus Limnocylindrales bacterium]
MVAVNVALFSLPLLEARRRRRPAPRWMTRIGWIGQAAAIGLRLWVIATLRQAWTVTATVPSDLVVVDRGPYRFVRHPNYVAVALEFLALPLIGGAAASAAVLSAANALVLRDRILAEERLLARLPDYLTRMGDRPRFVPRLRDLTGPRADGSSRAPRSDRIPSTRS